MKSVEIEIQNSSETKIWVKLFNLNGKTYCYDVGTNHLMQITEVLADALSLYNYANSSDVKKALAPKYTDKDIFNALKIIEEFNQGKGGFILEKRIRLKFPFNQEEYRYLLDNFLRHLVLNITDDCNMRCKYCAYTGSYRYKRKHAKNSMTWSTIKKAVDFFIPRCKLSVKEMKKGLTIGFYGGEPLLEQEKIFKTVDYVKTKYPDVFPDIGFFVTTNGLLLSENTIKKLIRHNFALALSLDGPEEIHDRNRIQKNGKGSFKVLMKNIERIQSINSEYYKKRVNYSVVISPEYDLYKVINFFREDAPYQEGSNIFSLVERLDTTYFEQFNMAAEEGKLLSQYNELINDFIKKKALGVEDKVLCDYIKDDFADIHNRRLFNLPDTTYPNGCCPPGIKKVFVDTEGNFHTCEKGGLEFSIGNVDNGFDTRKIFNLVEQYSESSDHCKYCWAIRFCNACFLSAIENDKFSKKRKEENCKAIRTRVLNRLQTYICLTDSNPRVFDGQYHRGEDIVADLVAYLEKRQVNKR